MDEVAEFNVQQILAKHRTKEKFYVSPEVEITKHLQEAWKEALLVDYTIQVGAKEFKVHKIVMACVSDYFKAMLTGSMVESREDSVRLEGLDSLAVSNIIEYIYTNRITGERASPEDLLGCAVYLQIPTAIRAASRILQKNIDNENCLDILTTFDTFSLVKAIAHIEEYITTNMNDIVKINQPGTLTYEHLLILVRLWKDGEWDLFMTIKDWLDVDYENRKKHLDSLMSHVRFSLLTPAQLEAVKKMKMYFDGSWRDNIQQAQDYHKQPVHKKMMRPSSVRNKLQPLCIDHQNPSIMHALGEDDSWKAINVPTSLEFKYGVAAVLEFNNFLIICEPFCESYSRSEQPWHVFDPATLTWSRMAGMNTYRNDFPLVHDEKYIYAIGGTTGSGSGSYRCIDTIERYDPETNIWTVMPTKLPKSLYEHCACVCSGPFFSIYVAGGWEGHPRVLDFSPDLNCFNPREEAITWYKKAPMLMHADSRVMREMAFMGKDPAIIIMCDDLIIQIYDLQTDQWSLWNGYGNIHVDWRWHDNGTVLADPSENTLYVLNICEQFPGMMKENEQAVCGKWPLSKEDDAVFAYPVAKFPLTMEWEDYSEADYIAAMLAMPASSKTKLQPLTQSEKMPVIPALSGAEAAAELGTKRYNLRKSKS